MAQEPFQVGQGPEWGLPLGWRFAAKSAAWLSQKSGRFWQVLDSLVSRRSGLLEVAPDRAV
jgi:hypothetical protein